jgi:protochlorophyllide reductase
MRAIVLSLALTAVAAFSPATLPKTALRTNAFLSAPLFQRQTIPSLTERSAVLQQQELPQKLYFPEEKEIPKVLGGVKIGLRKLVVVTGASSGLGLNCAVTLAKTGRYFVVMACRDVEKGKRGKHRSFN